MNTRTVVAALLIGLVGLLTPAAADIPSWVDFKAIYDGPGGPSDWDVTQDKYDYNTGSDGPITWQDSDSGSRDIIHIPNESEPLWTKQLWLELVWADDAPEDEPTIFATPDLKLPSGSSAAPRTATRNATNKSWTWNWLITPQPAWEDILFNTTAVYDLEIDGATLEKVEVGTYCSPEPGAAVAYASLGVMGLAWFGRRRKRGNRRHPQRKGR